MSTKSGVYCKPYEVWFNQPEDSVYTECIAIVIADYSTTSATIDVTVRRYVDNYQNRYFNAKFPKVWFRVKMNDKWSYTPFDQIPTVDGESTHAYAETFHKYQYTSNPTKPIQGIGVSFFKSPTTSHHGDGIVGELTHSVNFDGNGPEWQVGKPFTPDETRYVKINVPSIIDGHPFEDNAGMLLSIKDREDGSFMMTGVQYNPHALVDANFRMDHAELSESVEEELGSGWGFVEPVSNVNYSPFSSGIGSILEGGSKHNQLYCEWKSAAGYLQGELMFSKLFGDYEPSRTYKAYSDVSYGINKYVAYLTHPLSIWEHEGVAYMWDGYQLHVGSSSDEALGAKYSPSYAECPDSYKVGGWPCYWRGLVGYAGDFVCPHDPPHYIGPIVKEYPLSLLGPDGNFLDGTKIPSGYVELRGKKWPAKKELEFWVGVPIDIRSTEMRFRIERFTPTSEYIGSWRETGWISSSGGLYGNWDINGIMQHGFDRVPLSKTVLSLHAAPSLPAMAGYTRELWTVKGSVWNFARWPFELPQRSAEKTGSMDQRSNKTQIVDYKDKKRTIWGLAHVKGTTPVPDPAYDKEQALSDPEYKLTPYLDPGFYLVPLGFESLDEDSNIPPLKLDQRDDGRGLSANARLNRYSAEMASNGSIRLESGAYRA